MAVTRPWKPVSRYGNCYEVVEALVIGNVRRPLQGRESTYISVLNVKEILRELDPLWQDRELVTPPSSDLGMDSTARHALESGTGMIVSYSPSIVTMAVC